MTEVETIAILGIGTIGLSFAALHLQHSAHSVILYDTRPNISSYVEKTLPGFFQSELSSDTTAGIFARITIVQDLQEAVSRATIVQECLPENLSLKASLWPQIEQYAPGSSLFWSSTSGIPASAQSADMKDKSRVLVVHPFNPPHIMPLLELVPSPSTSASVIERTRAYWKLLGRNPILIGKEQIGFVANRLAFALLREAVHLVGSGVVSVQELDSIVETSMGPRWAIAGPFKSYTAGGGEGGLDWWFKNIGDTVQGCWDDAGRENVDGEEVKEACRQSKEAYGIVDTKARDRITRKVLQAVDDEKRNQPN